MKLTAWAIINPKNKILIESIRAKKGSCIDDFLDGRLNEFQQWETHHRLGYRISKIELGINLEENQRHRCAEAVAAIEDEEFGKGIEYLRGILHKAILEAK